MSVLQADNQRLSDKLRTLTTDLEKQKEETAQLQSIIREQKQKTLGAAQLEVHLILLSFTYVFLYIFTRSLPDRQRCSQ